MLSSSIKKIFCTGYLLFLSFFLFAKPVPEWVQDYRKVYPKTIYIAQQGLGDTAEKAKTDASVAISRYFKTNVTSNHSSTINLVATNGIIQKDSVLIDDVNVQSKVDFFGLEYTEPYYLKSEKKWYCVVYINRQEAWQQYKPQIEIKKNSFNGLYKNLEKQTDYFTKLVMCKKVWLVGKELLEMLEYGRIINPEGEAIYQGERDAISNIPVIFEDSSKNCSIFIEINLDFTNLISTSVSNAFRDSGVMIEKKLSESNYKVEVIVDDNITGNDPFSIKPSITLKITSKDGKTVYSYEDVASDKYLGYALETARKKAYPAFATKIEENLKKDFKFEF